VSRIVGFLIHHRTRTRRTGLISYAGSGLGAKLSGPSEDSYKTVFESLSKVVPTTHAMSLHIYQKTCSLHHHRSVLNPQLWKDSTVLENDTVMSFQTTARLGITSSSRERGLTLSNTPPYA